MTRYEFTICVRTANGQEFLVMLMGWHDFNSIECKNRYLAEKTYIMNHKKDYHIEDTDTLFLHRVEKPAEAWWNKYGTN